MYPSFVMSFLHTSQMRAPHRHFSLLQPSSLTIANPHWGHLRIKAAVIASSTVWRTSRPRSFFASSQVWGICVSCLQRRQLTFSQSEFRQVNSLFCSTGGQIALKSQNGHSSRPSMLAFAISSCCCKSSNRFISLSPITFLINLLLNWA